MVAASSSASWTRSFDAAIGQANGVFEAGRVQAAGIQVAAGGGSGSGSAFSRQDGSSLPASKAAAAAAAAAARRFRGRTGPGCRHPRWRPAAAAAAARRFRGRTVQAAELQGGRRRQRQRLGVVACPGLWVKADETKAQNIFDGWVNFQAVALLKILLRGGETLGVPAAVNSQSAFQAVAARRGKTKSDVRVGLHFFADCFQRAV